MITMHAHPRQTDRRTNIMAIAWWFILTNALRTKNASKLSQSQKNNKYTPIISYDFLSVDNVVQYSCHMRDIKCLNWPKRRPLIYQFAFFWYISLLVSVLSYDITCHCCCGCRSFLHQTRWSLNQLLHIGSVFDVLGTVPDRDVLTGIVEEDSLITGPHHTPDISYITESHNILVSQYNTQRLHSSALPATQHTAITRCSDQN